MPEGDTVSKLADRLRFHLLGESVSEVRLARRDGACLDGQSVRGVSSHGKHLYIAFGNGLTLRSHLGLHGSWHRYGPDEAWRRPARQAGIVLRTAQQVLVCFNLREVAIEATHGFAARDRAARLGPDLAAADTPPDGCTRRARALLPPQTPAVDLLLDQRVAAGIGNVYKSEVLFLARVAPLAGLGTLDDARLDVLYDLAGALIRGNLGTGRRVTRRTGDGRGGLWVYRRRDLPCFECGTPIRSARLGRDLRSTYWCPDCQGSC